MSRYTHSFPLTCPTDRIPIFTYYLTLEVAQVATGMDIALGPDPWEIFQQMNTAEFAATLVTLAQHLDTAKYTKHKRGPKKQPPKRLSGKHHSHISTARILAPFGEINPTMSV